MVVVVVVAVVVVVVVAMVVVVVVVVVAAAAAAVVVVVCVYIYIWTLLVREPLKEPPFNRLPLEGSRSPRMPVLAVLASVQLPVDGGVPAQSVRSTYMGVSENRGP